MIATSTMNIAIICITLIVLAYMEKKISKDIKEAKHQQEEDCGKIKCTVCGFEFKPKEEDYYISERKSFLSDPITMECYDCPNCGCQAVLHTRI